MKNGEDITPHDFTRIAAQVMRQTFYQRLNEVHNEQLLGGVRRAHGRRCDRHRTTGPQADDAGRPR